MDMQAHILAAMREQFERWETILGSDPRLPDLLTLGDWTTKDVLIHLWAWQQVTLARIEAALRHGEPVFPTLFTEIPGDWEEAADRTNAHVYEACHAQSWSTVHGNWRTGYLRLLESAAKIPEIELLDAERFPWLHGWSPAFVLIASYDHHKEHYDKLLAWMRDHDLAA